MSDHIIYCSECDETFDSYEAELTHALFVHYAARIRAIRDNDYDWRADTNVYPFDTIVYDAPAFGGSDYDGGDAGGSEPLSEDALLVLHDIAGGESEGDPEWYRDYASMIKQEQRLIEDELEPLYVEWLSSDYSTEPGGFWIVTPAGLDLLRDDRSGGDVPGTEAAADAPRNPYSNPAASLDWLLNELPRIRRRVVEHYPTSDETTSGADADLKDLLRLVDLLVAERAHLTRAEVAADAAPVCPQCNGRGQVLNRFSDWVPCFTCEGSGKAQGAK